MQRVFQDGCNMSTHSNAPLATLPQSDFDQVRDKRRNIRGEESINLFIDLLVRSLSLLIQLVSSTSSMSLFKVYNDMTRVGKMASLFVQGQKKEVGKPTELMNQDLCGSILSGSADKMQRTLAIPFTIQGFLHGITTKSLREQYINVDSRDHFVEDWPRVPATLLSATFQNRRISNESLRSIIHLRTVADLLISRNSLSGKSCWHLQSRCQFSMHRGIKGCWYLKQVRRWYSVITGLLRETISF